MRLLHEPVLIATGFSVAPIWLVSAGRRSCPVEMLANSVHSVAGVRAGRSELPRLVAQPTSLTAGCQKACRKILTTGNIQGYIML